MSHINLVRNLDLIGILQIAGVPYLKGYFSGYD